MTTTHDVTDVTTPGGSPNGGPPPAPDVAASRLLGTLTFGGALAGILLVVAFGLTLPAIEANKARALDVAVKEVLKSPEHYDTLYVVNGALTKQLPPGADAKKLEQVYLGYTPDHQRVGFAIMAANPGFQDVITLIFGYDARSRKLIGMKVLESKETPGLGDKIETDRTFIGQFDGVQAPLTGVKKGKRSGGRDVEMITGATISSRAVIRIINKALERLGPMVESYREEGRG